MKKQNLFKGLVLVLILMSSFHMYGQGTIAGTIVDDTGETLIGANIIVAGSTEGTVTDFDGTFSFKTSEWFPLTLLVSFTGYTSQEILLDGPSSNVSVTLTEGILFGSDVIISASRKREKVQEAPASVSVLSTKALESSSNPADATRNLVNTQGVQIQQQSANRINISMRGGSGLFGTSVFPIMDYRSLVGPGIGTFQSDQAGIMNLDLNRIEVVRGPGSALYGPGVTQGVVHFLTKSPIDFPGTSFEIMAGELSTYGAAVRHATKVSDKFGFKINAQHRRGNEFEYDPNDPTDAAYIGNMLPDQGQGRGLYRPGVTSDGFIGGASELIRSFEELDEDGNGNAMQKDWWNTSLNTTLEFRPKDNLSVNVSGGFNAASSLFFNEQGPGVANANEYWAQARVQAGGFFAQVFYLDNDGGQGENPTFLYKTGNRSSIARNQLESQLQYNFGTESFLDADWTVGIDYRFSAQDTENLTYGRNDGDDDFSVVGGYIQTKIPLGEKVDMVLAGRYDQFNFIDETAFSPRAAFVYKMSPKHTLRTSFNRANSSVSNLQLNIDFPLNTVIPGAFDIWLYGNKTTQTFGSSPTIDWFTGALPSIPVGTPGAGLPLAAITQQMAAPGVTLYDAVLGQLMAGLLANPATAPAAPIVQGVLSNINQATLGFGGQLSPGFNIFDGSPLGLLDAPISAISTVDNIEIGYKGLIANKLSVALDGYWVRENNNSQFTAISPAYTLLGIDGIAGDLGAAIQAQAQPAIQAQLIAAGFPADQAAATAALLGGAINGAYTAGGDQLLNTASPAFGGATLNQVLNGLPFHATTQTEQVPSNGVTHLAAGYRTFGPRSYFGTDLGLEYYAAENLTVFGNHSWISKNEFMQDVIGAPEGSAPLPTNLNAPKNKFRLGARLTPDYGVQAQLAFQHDGEFEANAGDFSGTAMERNLVDASVGYKFESGLRIGLTANNLFNNEYRYYPNMPVIGRRMLATLSYAFGG
ncbi:MAG: outer membrane receptor for ferrienterochelin and colicins [Saprospiraceae bacterium]|jgi:outer membrane receptor for ferrienterochelin and colicins